MEDEVALWVCPSCEVLQGIQVAKISDSSKLMARCVNCGVSLDINDVVFVNQQLASELIDRTFSIIPEEFHDEIRFHWLSNKTLGIVFEMPYAELQPEVDEDLLSYFDDDLATEYGISITVYFE